MDLNFKLSIRLVFEKVIPLEKKSLIFYSLSHGKSVFTRYTRTILNLGAVILGV